MGTHAAVAHSVAAGGRDLAEQAAQSPWVERMARAGLAARGVLYSLVGVVALQVAAGRQDQRADKDGALATLARQPLGRLGLAAVAVGFAAYGVWRLLDAVLGTAGEDGASGWAKRARDLGRAVLYGSFCLTAVRILAGSRGDDGSKEADVTAAVLRAPLGRVAVGAVGLAVIATGLYNGWRAFSGKYERKLRTAEMGPRLRPAVTAVAAAGLSARMVVFVLVGSFIVKAAVRYDPNEAVGVDGALKRLAARSYGPWLLGVVAAGLLLYGLYLFVEARYRRIEPVDPG